MTNTHPNGGDRVSLATYWHTLRHLRPVQFYGRLWFRLYRPRPDQRPAPELRPPAGAWAGVGMRPASLLGPASFRFLNTTHRVEGPTAWNDPTRDKLWLYNLHYFDDLHAADAAARTHWHQALLQRWVAENPPGRGNGWEPYPTSLRMVNWIKWALAGNTLPPACVHSLAVQARWLSRRLEHHLLGNHLFANAKALVFAGAFFVGDEAEHWRARGRRLLVRELGEQILPDGGHFERSPMYHAILLEDVLDLIALAEAYPQTTDPATLALYRDRAVAMTDWLQAMCHPDGEIAFFNDAAFGIAPTLAELVDYGRRLDPARKLQHEHVGRTVRILGAAPQPTWLRDSGYVRLQDGPAVALLDVAPIGPDYLPGHAHADTLSFELSLFGQRVIVNGGTSRYGNGPERLAERGTAAHSTVQINGLDSSEVWGGFRVARRARPLAVRVELGDPCRVSAAHDGYRRLPGRPIHWRSWELSATGLTVTDRIDGVCATAVVRFHLHPDIEAEVEGSDGAGRLHLPGGQTIRWRISGGTARLVADQWHPQFGLSAASHCLELQLTAASSQLDLNWTEGCRMW